MSTDLKSEEVAAFNKVASKTGRIALNLIVKSDIALRDVKRNEESFQTLLESIREKGVLNSILVREQVDPMDGTVKYGLIDGLQRYTASCDLDLQTIPANIVNMDDGEVLEAQLVTNLNRVETKPAEQSKHLLRILTRNPFMTKADLAKRVCQSITWVEQRVGLNNLSPAAQELVNANRIKLTNAYVLSQLDQEEQANFLDQAQMDDAQTFVPLIKQRIKDIRTARKNGDEAKPAGFQPVAFMRKMVPVKSESESLETAKMLLAKYEVTTPLEAFKLALEWVLNFDPESKAAQQAEYEAKQAKIAEEKAKRAAEREAKKLADAANATAEATEEFDLATTKFK